MSITFPSNPTTDETFFDAGVIWKWDGEKWVSQGTAEGGPISFTDVYGTAKALCTIDGTPWRP